MKIGRVFLKLIMITSIPLFCLSWVFFGVTFALKNADVLIGGRVSYTLPILETTAYPELTFTLHGNTATASVEVNHAKGDLIVPSKVLSNGKVYTVTSIDTDGVGSQISSIVIPSTVTKIELTGSRNLTTVTFQEGSQMEELSAIAFRGCFSLTTINLPEGLKSIGFDAFKFCSSLTHITLPSSLESIGEFAFSGSALESVTIPASVTTIENFAFYECTNLKTVYIDSDTISSGLAEETPCGLIVYYATTVYIKEECRAGEYITSNFTSTTSDQSGYVKYVKNS